MGSDTPSGYMGPGKALVGDHDVELRLHAEVSTTLKVRVESTNPLPEEKVEPPADKAEPAAEEAPTKT